MGGRWTGESVLGLNWTLSLLSMGLPLPLVLRFSPGKWQAWLPKSLGRGEQIPSVRPRPQGNTGECSLPVKACSSGSAQPGTSPRAQLGDPSVVAEAPFSVSRVLILKYGADPLLIIGGIQMSLSTCSPPQGPRGQAARESRPCQRHAKRRGWGPGSGLRGSHFGLQYRKTFFIFRAALQCSRLTWARSPFSEECQLSSHELTHSSTRCVLNMTPQSLLCRNSRTSRETRQVAGQRQRHSAQRA